MEKLSFSQTRTVKANIWTLVLTCMALILAFQSCIKPKQYPEEPVIEFKSFTVINDSARIIFSFTDGDGNIGLGENEIQPPYDTGSRFYNNVFIRYYEKVNGSWQQGINGDGEPIEFTYRTKEITPSGKNKALKGDIIIYLVPIFYNPFSPHSDTIKFDIQMADRALNLSNIVETQEIIR